LEGSAAPVPVEDAPLVGAAATSVREKVAVTVTTWGVSPWPVGVEVTTVTEVKTWVDGGADEAVTTLVAMGAALLVVAAGGGAADDCGGALDWAGGGACEVDGAGAGAEEAGGGAWLEGAAASLEGGGAALDGAALEGGGASDEGAAAEGELEAGAGLEGVFSGGLEDGAGAEEASVGAGVAVTLLLDMLTTMAARSYGARERSGFSNDNDDATTDSRCRRERVR
jgi:hypothetical protein